MSRMSDRKKKKAEQAKKDEPKLLVRASNRRAYRNYVIELKIEVGLALRGSEVKSLRLNTPTINEGFARVDGGELWLYSIHIPPLSQASYQNHEPTRRRKCLVHRRELNKIETLLGAEGKTMVPLSLYFKGPHVKVELGIGRGRRKADKRAHEREKEDRKRIREKNY